MLKFRLAENLQYQFLMIIILEALIACQVQDGIVSNDFTANGSESECFAIKPCGK